MTLKLNLAQCKSCPFKTDGLELSADTMERIYKYLSEGENHLCHSHRSKQVICLGGRLKQLQLWQESGLIFAPTHQALVEAMLSTGVAPAEHIFTGLKLELTEQN